jgi:4-amino-4-deoxy-L-arabinose transferase
LSDYDSAMKWPPIGLLALFLFLYLAPLGVRPLIVPDEFRYAEIPREMLASGDWVVPRLNGLRYFEKPPLGYWVNAASLALFGQNRLAARLPSAVATGISALLLFHLVRRLSGIQGAAPLAAGIFLTSLEVYAVGTFNVLDSTFSLFVNAAMVSFLFGYRAASPRRESLFLGLSGIFCGMGFLTKGFIAIAIPAVAVLPFLMWERRTRPLFRLFLLPLIFALVTVLPWGIMIHLREPDFWHYFFWTEHIHRFFALEAQHAKPFWYFLPILVVGSLPWSALAPAAVLGLKKVPMKGPLTRFALSWLLFPFVFFSASHGKLPSYILPCFVPLAVLLAMGLHSYLEEGKTRLFTVAALFGVSVLAILALSLAVVQTGLFGGFIPYGQTLKWTAFVAGLLSWALVLLLAIRGSDGRKKVTLYGAAPVLLLFLSHFLTPDLTLEHKAPGPFLDQHFHRIRPDTVLVSDENPICAVSWSYRRSDVYVVDDPGELSYGLRYKGARHRLLTLEQLRNLTLRNRGTGRVTLIAEEKKYRLWTKTLPRPLFEDNNGPGGFVFAQF